MSRHATRFTVDPDENGAVGFLWGAVEFDGGAQTVTLQDNWVLQVGEDDNYNDTLGLGPATITWTDATAARLLGLSPEKLLGSALADCLADDAAALSELISSAGANGGSERDFKIRLPDDSQERWLRIAAGPASEDDGEATSLACLDVTQQKTAADELNRYVGKLDKTQAELKAAKQTKSDFLATMSHELRTPMHEFMGMVDLVLHTELTDEQELYLTKAKDSAEGLVALVTDIVEFNELQSGRLSLDERDFDLWQIVGKTMAMML